MYLMYTHVCVILCNKLVLVCVCIWISVYPTLSQLLEREEKNEKRATGAQIITLVSDIFYIFRCNFFFFVLRK